MPAHVDDDELEKNGPNRMKARNRPPHVGTSEKSIREKTQKLAKVRGEKQKGKEKNADYSELSNSFLAK
jgi:hypothetical protein